MHAFKRFVEAEPKVIRTWLIGKIGVFHIIAKLTAKNLNRSRERGD